jgi:hypothetical protein
MKATTIVGNAILSIFSDNMFGKGEIQIPFEWQMFVALSKHIDALCHTTDQYWCYDPYERQDIFTRCSKWRIRVNNEYGYYQHEQLCNSCYRQANAELVHFPIEL